MEYNCYFLCVGDSQRYSKRANDSGHRRRLKGGERIYKSYQRDASNVLQVIDEEHSLFCVQSETIPGTWYNVSLDTHFCNCPDRNFTCKHILGVQWIFKSKNEAPQEPHSQKNGMVDDMLVMEDNALDVLPPSPVSMNVEIEEPSTCDESKTKLLSGFEELEKLVQIGRTSIGEYTADELKHKSQLIQSFMRLYSEPFTFQRPGTIDLPRQGVGISIVQEHIGRTRMGHGKQHITVPSKSSEKNALRPPLKRPSHMLVSHLKQKRVKFSKLPKVNCEQCDTLNFVPRGAPLYSCTNCDHEMIKQ